MSFDPFAEIRCRDCGWVHFRELRCPPVTMRSAWLLLQLRLMKLARDLAEWRRMTLGEAREALRR